MRMFSASPAQCIGMDSHWVVLLLLILATPKTNLQWERRFDDQAMVERFDVLRHVWRATGYRNMLLPV